MLDISLYSTNGKSPLTINVTKTFINGCFKVILQKSG